MKKLMIQSWENLVTDGHMDRQKEGETSSAQNETKKPSRNKNFDFSNTWTSKKC